MNTYFLFGIDHLLDTCMVGIFLVIFAISNIIMFYSYEKKKYLYKSKNIKAKKNILLK